MYIDISRRLRDAVCWKRPVKWRTDSWFLLRDNAPAHRSVLVKDFLANNNMTALEYPPYSLDLVTTDFYIFPQLISALKGRSCSESTDSNKSVAESGILTLILRRSRTGTVWFYTSTSNKRAERPKLYTKSLTRDLKLMYSRLTLVRISINL